MSLQGPGSQSHTLSQHLVLAPVGTAAGELGSKSLIEPVFLPSVGHGPQRGVSCLEVPPKDDPVVQAVGLALPEFYHLWI